jgi:hypothetical protein
MIAFLIFEGKHLLEKGKNLIIKLGDSMNNSRLSTNSNRITLDNETKSELTLLMKSEPLITVDSEGRAMIKKTNKYIRSTYIIETNFIGGSISYFSNGVSCAKALHISINTLTQRLTNGKPVKNKDGLITALKVKRIKAYSPQTKKISL